MKKYLMYIIPGVIIISSFFIYNITLTSPKLEDTSSINLLHEQKDTLFVLADQILQEVNNTKHVQQEKINNLDDVIKIKEQKLKEQNKLLKNITIESNTNKIILDSVYISTAKYKDLENKLKQSNKNYNNLLEQHYIILDENVLLIEKINGLNLIINTLMKDTININTSIDDKIKKKKKRKN